MSAKPSRPSLTSLSDRFARKELVAPPPSTAPAIEPAASSAPSIKAAPKDDRVQVLVRMTADERRSLRRIALDQDTTVQALVEETLRDLLRRHGA